MASTSNSAAQVLINKGKCGAAAYIHAECSNSAIGNGCPQNLNELLDIFLSPTKAIDDWETIDWCKWLMAGGRTPTEFAKTGQSYNFIYNIILNIISYIHHLHIYKYQSLAITRFAYLVATSDVLLNTHLIPIFCSCSRDINCYVVGTYKYII